MAMLAMVGVCSAPVADGRASRPVRLAESYRNPVLDSDFPDPDVIRAANGWYYAYSTESDRAGRHVNIQVERSRDLVQWEDLGDALPLLPSWGDRAVPSWAPEVIARRGAYYLFYSMVPNRLRVAGSHCVAVATSQQPAGPFEPTSTPVYCGPTLSDIDASVFHDTATGHWHMYWSSGGDIVTARLASSLTGLAAGAAPTLLLRRWSATVHRPYEHRVEAPFIIARRDWYYLFYSGNNCCSDPPHYATMVARSHRAAGPYHRLEITRPGLSSIILHSNRRWAGPRHISVITDLARHDWMVFHAVDTDNPYRPGGHRVVRRMLMDRVVYRDGWPTVAGDAPSIGWTPAPVTR